MNSQSFYQIARPKRIWKYGVIFRYRSSLGGKRAQRMLNFHTQLVLERSGLMTAIMQSSQITLSAALLLAAGFWQFSATRLACLRNCQSPVEYLIRYRRPGNIGAFSMGFVLVVAGY